MIPVGIPATSKTGNSLPGSENQDSDAPTWTPWDEEAYAAVLGYDARPAADALTLILALRHVNVRLLASMSPELWTRTAVHPSEGTVDVAGWVRIANEHLAAHVLQARRAVIGMV